MTRNLLARLKKVEKATAPYEPWHIMLVAADDPEAQELIAQHQEWRPGDPAPDLIILTGVHRSPRGIVQ
jgi:hypothetical protein